MQTTFPRLLIQHASQRPGAPAMREKAYGIWQVWTWADLLEMVRCLAAGLHQAGLRRGEHMVVVGANRPRLYATMLAVQSLGAVPVPLYQDAVAAERQDAAILGTLIAGGAVRLSVITLLSVLRLQSAVAAENPGGGRGGNIGVRVQRRSR